MPYEYPVELNFLSVEHRFETGGEDVYGMLDVIWYSCDSAGGSDPDVQLELDLRVRWFVLDISGVYSSEMAGLEDHLVQLQEVQGDRVAIINQLWTVLEDQIGEVRPCAIDHHREEQRLLHQREQRRITIQSLWVSFSYLPGLIAHHSYMHQHTLQETSV